MCWFPFLHPTLLSLLLLRGDRWQAENAAAASGMSRVAAAAAAADAVEMRLSRRSPRHLHNRNPASSFLSLFQRMMILAEIPHRMLDICGRLNSPICEYWCIKQKSGSFLLTYDNILWVCVTVLCNSFYHAWYFDGFLHGHLTLFTLCSEFY